MVQFIADSTDATIPDRLHTLVQQQCTFFRQGQTRAIGFRLAQLKALRQAVVDQQDVILTALKADLNKPEFEAHFAEIRAVTKEIDQVVSHLRQWMQPQRVPTPLPQWPGRMTRCPEPLGVVLILSPWNYPLQLLLVPLVDAIAAGNCALLKPSEVAPHTAQVIASLIQQTFDPAYVTVVEGGVATSQRLLEEKFDHIFFTGSTAIGKVVMAAAAKHLTPVTLELGGKSPCVVDADVHLEHAAKRIAWGKFLNAGQTCVAPDYLLVDRRIKSDLIAAIQHYTREFYGENPAQSPDYARIVNAHHLARLTNLLQSGHIVMGGQSDPQTLYLAPTLLDQISANDPVMQEEIFGPILPVLEYDDIQEAIDFVNDRPKPLALYFFSRNPVLQQRVLQSTSSGGACLNDVVMHSASPTLPFGGVGESGMGSYHGKAGFDTFSHDKSIFARSLRLDLPLRYAPYGHKLKWLKRIFG